MPKRDSAPPGCSLLIRNLSRSTRPEDLRHAAEKYGRVRDIYLPRDYYSGEPRGIGFLEYTDPRDAEDAKDALDRALIDGREISVVYAKEGRKAPDDYRPNRRSSGYGRRSRSRSPRRRSYSPRRHRRSYSRSRSPRGRERRSQTRTPSHSPERKISMEKTRSPGSQANSHGGEKSPARE